MKRWLISKFLHSHTVANASQYRYKRGSKLCADMFVMISCIQGFPINIRTSWHVKIRASLQLVQVLVFVSCLMPIKMTGKPIGKTRYLVNYSHRHFVPKVAILWFSEVVLFCFLLSLCFLCVLLYSALGSNWLGVASNTSPVFYNQLFWHSW